LSANPVSVPPEKIKDIQVELTMAGRKVIYRR
jgi:predicted amidohydrolase YtcJ